jgi:hypothetical protein
MESSKKQKILNFFSLKRQVKKKIFKNQGEPPCGRFGHTGVIDHEDWYIFGGEDQNSKRLNDLVCLNLMDYTWTIPSISGIPPCPRSNHSAVWHDHKMIVKDFIF